MWIDLVMKADLQWTGQLLSLFVSFFFFNPAAQSKQSTEALRGIGIYRWQVCEGGKKEKRIHSLQPFFLNPHFIFNHRRNCDQKWKLWVDEKDPDATFTPFEFCSSSEEQHQPWRKSMISSSNSYSSGTAEWAKHVWSSALLRTISTLHTFPPSVRCNWVKFA